jgi:N,N'-diacetyllegionaminate synthase
MRIFENTNNSCYIIAEIGINHNGSIDTCLEMIERAKHCGADAVKLQTVDPDENYVTSSESYQVFKANSLTADETSKAFEYAKELAVDIFTTVGDLKTLTWVDELDPVAYKISSGLFTHTVLIDQIIKTKRPVLMSTGMSDNEEIDFIMKHMQRRDCSNLALFQCTSIYPAPSDTLNLSRISYLKGKYDVPVGFSDHSLGIDAAAFSVAAGATILEKHFTLDKTQPGVDHAISINSDELKCLVSKIREVELMMGDAQAALNPKIQENKQKYQRYLVAKKDIECGDILTDANIAIKRIPTKNSNGYKAYRYYDVLGGKINAPLKRDHLLQENMITRESYNEA